MFHAKLNISAIMDLIRFQDVAASGTTPSNLFLPFTSFLLPQHESGVNYLDANILERLPTSDVFVPSTSASMRLKFEFVFRNFWGEYSAITGSTVAPTLDLDSSHWL